ncbi:bacteriophage abortive infection protein AbiH [Streptococcus sp. AS20]|uniref:AbiH family protein n=1 Tax=Streptococcus TaxID=1301 RepID=UPI00044A7146|nr:MULTISPECIES: AbiH family protein [Streptococcus]EUB23289.1 bacteriophage abortive infection protein AbiH [Streptococcus sp. AS20]MDK6971514.1 AbiH family protein [Streptococcus constellatus]
MRRRLFVIGNGFDLHFGLPTKVSDFKDYLSYQNVYSMGNAREVYDSYGVNWSEFEKSLASISIDCIYEENAQGPDYLSDRESDRDGGIIEMVELTDQFLEARNNALNEMINNTESKIQSIQSPYRKSLFNDSIIISFNYTSTLETLFDLQHSEVYHIHGYFPNQDKLIFGYKKEERSLLETNATIYSKFEEEIYKISHDSKLSDNEKELKRDEIKFLYEDGYYDYYLDQQREVVNSFYKSNKKTFRYDELKAFLADYVEQSIDEVVVLGQSMAEVDSEYMEIIEGVIKPKRWIISQFEGQPDKLDLKNYTFNKKISFCTIDDFAKDKINKK